MERRAVITGVGIISPLGVGKEENWKRLCAGESCIGPLSRFKPEEIGVYTA